MGTKLLPLSPWIIPVPPYAVWNAKCPQHLSTKNGRHLLNVETAISPHVIRRHFDLHQIFIRTWWPHSSCAIPFTQYRYTNYAAKMLVFIETIDYLDHVVHPRRLEIVSHTTEAIIRLKAPGNLTVLSLFLGLCNVIRRIFPTSAHLAAPMNKSLRKDQPTTFVSLNNKELRFMKLFNDALLSPPILTSPNSMPT